MLRNPLTALFVAALVCSIAVLAGITSLFSALLTLLAIDIILILSTGWKLYRLTKRMPRRRMIIAVLVWWPQ